MKKFLFFPVFLGSFLSVQGQGEAANWYFGVNAGLDFNGGAPVALTNGQLNTIEGCSSISDFNGNLLFYTDGITVWNRNHTVMPNGTGLSGHPSSTQSGIIVPSPASPDIYYVFTVDEAGNAKGLQYNIIDLTQDGGLGDVITKNVLLETPVTEKLTAISHANGTDIWVVAHRYGSNDFISYLVTATGVSASPVVSSIGFDYLVDNDIRGYMKISPDGSMLAITGHASNDVELFQFDNASGTLSNPISIDNYFTTPVGSLFNITYGLEFSSDSSKLYVSNTIFHTILSTTSSIHQFDLGSYIPGTVTGSGAKITPDQVNTIGALQLAIDGKIYVAQDGHTFLGVIDSPNVLGVASNYVENGVSLAGRLSSNGLPPFIQSYFVVGLQVNNFCFGEVTEFAVNTNGPVTSISWNFGDGSSSNLETPTHTYAAPATYTVSVTVSTVNETKTESREIIIYETPVANATSDYEICSMQPTFQFDLSTKDPEVLGGQLASEFTVTYFPTLVDAQNSTNHLPNSYANTNIRQAIFARISDINNPSCFDTTSFDLFVKEAPVTSTVTDWTVCDTDTDGLYNFDLSQKDTEIFNGQDTSVFSLAYFASQADADANTNALGPSHTNTGPSQPIFYRIYNTAYPECFETGSFQIEVILGVTAHAPTDREVCDDDNDGFHIFDLSLAGPEILGGQNPASIQISYHATQADAENGTDPYDATAYANTTAYGETVYIRAENISDGSCYDTTSFELRIYDAPMGQTVENWQVCDDDNDGFSTFDLAQKDVEVLGPQSATGFKVTYHLTEAEALAGTSPILGPITNAGNPQEIFYRLESNAHAPCFFTDSFLLEVFDTPTANNPSPIVLCDIDETGLRQINLSVRDAEILNGQDPAVYEVVYFRTEADALADQNPLPKQDYRNSAPLETLYARVEHRQLASCFNTVPLLLIINELPQPDLDTTYVICPDSPELTIDGGEFESWSWRDENNLEVATGRTIDIATLGDYSLTVSRTQRGVTCEKTVSFEVVSSGAPEDFGTEVLGFSDQVTIVVDAVGNGAFEYSVDGENFQDSDRITVFPGAYTVYVRDKFLCRTLSKDIIALGYQRFFTPNGDGTNEHWNIIGAEKYPESRLYIYNRYGKLLAQILAGSSGWDGTYDGIRMPSTDYWFRYVYDGTKVFSGHFALKR